MSNLSTIEGILDYAMEQEQAAVDLYTGLAAQAKSPTIKKMFEDFAGEERGHKAKIKEVKEGKWFMGPADKPVLDLKISEYTEDQEPGPDADYQQVLIFGGDGRQLRQQAQDMGAGPAHACRRGIDQDAHASCSFTSRSKRSKRVDQLCRRASVWRAARPVSRPASIAS